MGWLSGQLIDIIEWMDDGQETMVYRFERHNNEIKNGAKLVVRPASPPYLLMKAARAWPMSSSPALTSSQPPTCRSSP